MSAPRLRTAALLVGVVLIAGGLVAVVSGRARTRSGDGTRRRPSFTTTTSAVAATGWHPVAPATTVPEATPVQEEYDNGFRTGLSSASNRAMIARADSLAIPSPAIGGGWPELAPSNTPAGWATEFVTGLLDIDFSRQDRRALGAWLVAEEAPDLMPGIPPAFGERALYVSLLEPSITGQPSLLPGPSQWSADAEAGLRWSANDLEVELEPAWQQMIDAGWQPADIRAAVEDVTGVLTVTDTSGPVTARHFSMVVQTGSAHWRPGFGSVLVSDWKES